MNIPRCGGPCAQAVVAHLASSTLGVSTRTRVVWRPGGCRVGCYPCAAFYSATFSSVGAFNRGVLKSLASELATDLGDEILKSCGVGELLDSFI